MKYKALSLLLLFIMSKSFGQIEKPSYKNQNWKSFNLESSVKTVRTVTYELKDKFGEYVKDNFVDDETNIFDNEGTLIKYSSVRYGISIYEYGKSQTKLSHFDATIPSKIKSIDILKYDSKGYLVETNSYNNNGDKYFNQTILIDKEGYVKEIKTEYIGEIPGITNYHYESHKMISTSRSSLTKGVKQIHISTYNNKNQLIEFYWFEDKVWKQRYTVKYDEKGNIIQKIDYNVSNKAIFQQFSKYDYYGNIIEEKRIDKTGKVGTTTYKYEYDSKGNYTKKRTFQNTIPTIVEERTIIYY